MCQLSYDSSPGCYTKAIKIGDWAYIRPIALQEFFRTTTLTIRILVQCEF